MILGNILECEKKKINFDTSFLQNGQLVELLSLSLLLLLLFESVEGDDIVIEVFFKKKTQKNKIKTLKIG
jgi:hypothetical protein